MGGEGIGRFSDRVDDYARYRPGYAEELYARLRAATGLGEGTIVADVGSGTGLFARGLLDLGCRVLGIEPDAAMRSAAERELAGHPGFESIDGTAEATGLPPASVDLVTAAQAFHWFDPVAFRAECRRILRPGGWCALAWNSWDVGSPDLGADCHALYTALIPEYAHVSRKRSTDHDIQAFFRRGGHTHEAWPVEQPQDRAAFEGGCRSASYMPKPGQPGHDEVWEGLRKIFDRHQTGGLIRTRYQSELCLGLP